MKDALSTTFAYTTEGGRAAITAIQAVLPEMPCHAYVVVRRIMEMMKVDMATHTAALKQAELDALPPPPTIREERDV